MIQFTSRVFDPVPGLHPDDLALVGLPLTGWLAGQLEQAGARVVSGPDTNDFGWVLKVEFEGRRFLVGCHGTRSADHPGTADYAIVVQTVPRFVEAFTGGAPVEADDALILLIERLLTDGAICRAPTVLVDG